VEGERQANGGAARRPLVIGVAGGSGSGKTTVTRAILQRVGRERIAVLPHDSYYHDLSHLPLARRAQVNFDHPDAFDNARYLADVQTLVAGKPIALPTYDFATYVRLPEVVPVAPQPVVLLEGILIFADAALRAQMDIKVFVDTDDDARFIRRLQRDVAERGRTMDSVIEQYLASVKPMHLEFVQPSKRYADVIIPQGGHNKVAVDLLLTLIRSLV
jgi:uridine kinase